MFERKLHQIRNEENLLGLLKFLIRIRWLLIRWEFLVLSSLTHGQRLLELKLRYFQLILCTLAHIRHFRSLLFSPHFPG